VTGASLEENHDHVLGVLEASGAGVLIGRAGGFGRLLRKKEARQVQPREAERTDSQQFTPRGSFAGLSSDSSRNIQNKRLVSLDSLPRQPAP